MNNDTKIKIQAMITAHDDGHISDYTCADMLKRLIEQYFREERK